MRNDKLEDMNEFQLENCHRAAVPKTVALQASIIELAKLTPQDAALTYKMTVQKELKTFFEWLLLPRSAAIASVVCVMIGLAFFIGSYDGNLPSDSFSENDLEWQELMLIEDELLFAQL